MTERRRADEETLREFASRAHVDLEGFPEFGEETRDAIVDTAGMFLFDAGFDFDREELRRIATELAGSEPSFDDVEAAGLDGTLRAKETPGPWTWEDVRKANRREGDR